MGDLSMKNQAMNNTQIAQLAVIAVVGAALRLFDLGGESFWVDEGFSVYMGHLAQWSEWQRVEHPPLFYALVSVWMRIADTDTWLRLLPAMFGIAVIPVVFFIGRRMFDANTGFVAAGFMALTAFHVRFSRDLTMYSLEVFLFACALLAVAHIAASDDPKIRQRAWIAYVAAAAPLAWSQGLAPFYVGIVGLMLPLLRKDFFSSGLWHTWSIAHGVIVLCFLPWLSTYITRVQSISGDFWAERPDMLAPWRQIYEFTVGSIPSIHDRLGAGPDVWVWVVPIYLMLVVAIWRGLVEHNRSVIALSVALILPIATIYLVSILVRPVMVSRQMIATIVPLVLLLAVGCMHATWPRIARYATVIIIGSLLALSSAYHLRYMQKEDWRGASQFIAEHIKPGDTIVFNSYGDSFHGFLMGRYDPQKTFEGKRLIYIHPVLKQCRGDVTRCLDNVINEPKGNGTYWIVESHEQFLPNTVMVSNWLNTSFTKSDQIELIGVKVWKGELNSM